MEAVQKIKCINSSWFVLSFEVSGAKGEVLASGDLPIQRSGILDLAESSFQEGTEVQVQVKAAMGKVLAVQERLCFRCNGRTAVFEVSGTSLEFGVQLVGVE